MRPVSFAFLIAAAPNGNFPAGTAIRGFGPIATIDADQKIPATAAFRIRFDASEAAKEGELNRSFVSLARFINMSAEAGVAPEKVTLALVVHGGASRDLVAYDGNPNAPLLAALREKGVEIYLCGQSAAAQNISKDQLLPGVAMAVSAMHAHALLDAEGYSPNPF